MFFFPITYFGPPDMTGHVVFVQQLGVFGFSPLSSVQIVSYTTVVCLNNSHAKVTKKGIMLFGCVVRGCVKYGKCAGVRVTAFVKTTAAWEDQTSTAGCHTAV